MKKNNKRKNQKGFTLIELIVVIAILGILAAIAIPRLGGFNETAKIRTANANHKLVVNAINMAYSESNEWPDNAAAVAGYLDGFTVVVDTNDLKDDVEAVHSWDKTNLTLTTTLTGVDLNGDAEGETLVYKAKE